MGKSDSNSAEPRRGRSRRGAVLWFLARWSAVGAIWTGFFALLFLFVRLLPMISIFEMRTLLPEAQAHPTEGTEAH